MGMMTDMVMARRERSAAEIARIISAAIAEMHREDELPPVPFDHQDPELRQISVRAVEKIRAGRTSLREHHNDWVTAMLALGWVPGPKDPIAKTHPDLADWDALPEDRRDPARLFMMMTTALTRGAM